MARGKSAFSAVIGMAATLLSVTQLQGAAVMNGLLADNWISGTAVGDGTNGTGAALIDVNNGNFFVGRYDPTHVSVGVLVFQLPVLAAGERINSASLTYVTLTNATATLMANIDLYGLGYRSSSLVTSGDYYVGALDTTNATLLCNDLYAKWTAVSPSADQSRTTDSNTNGNLVAYLNAQYDAGAKGGEFVFIRFNYDAYEPGLTGRINLASANNATAGYAPYITYETATIPEPAGLFLVSLAGGLWLAYRRR